MKNLLNPKWLLLVNILPVALLFVVFFNNYNIIESLLNPASKVLWLKFFLALVVLTSLQLAYVIFCVMKQKDISIYYAVAALFAYISLLYCYMQHSDAILPNNIPNWMISAEAVFYPGTFLMPTLAHALFILVVVSSPTPARVNVWLNFLYGLSIPVAGYLFVLIILPLWQKPEDSFTTHVLVVLSITASTLFLFFICRGFYMLTSLQSSRLFKYAILWKLLIALLLPLLGLCVSNGIIGPGFTQSIFGNFKHPIFYIIATLNGILICLPAFENIYYRLIRFFGLIICYPYTLYFFFVFLPYLPISIVAVGVGFMMLAPLLLFILQTNELNTEFRFLKQLYPPIKISVGAVVALITIPLTITIFNLRDKRILTDALDYVYNTEYSKTYILDRESLLQTLTKIRQNKAHNSFFNENIPFITAYYNWLVLDNMILSDVKINTLEQIFFGEPAKQVNTTLNTTISPVKLSDIKVKSRFDEKQQAWISLLDLTLTNTDSANLVSYETEFSLPEGCWITDYYLNIGNRREQGILAEKKSALWVFSQIRNENRDPGILYYLSGNKIAFKIFPFSAKEVRKSGITFTHKTPVTLNLDGNMVKMGNIRPDHNSKVESVNHTTYIPADEKSKLQLVRRKPIYHFIIDVSKDQSKHIGSYTARIEHLISKHHLKKDDIRLQLTSTFSTEIPMDKNWKTQLSRQPFDGGFYLDGIMKKILLNSYQTNDGTFPILIVLTDTLKNAIVQHDFSDFKITYPENSNFYELDNRNKLWVHSFLTNPKLRLNETSEILNSVPVYAWPNVKNPGAYLPNDHQSSIIIDTQTESGNVKTEKKSWLSGLDLQGAWIRNTLNINHSEDTHFKIVKQSMLSGVLSPSTSFIALENKAQKMALLKKQSQILSGNKNLDPDEETQSMAEPNLYLLMALLLSFFIFRFKKNIIHAL